MRGPFRGAAGERAPLRAAWTGLLVLALGLLAGTAPACSAPLAESGGEAGPGLVVQADVLSGLPNPEWSLEAGETGELRHHFSRLRAADRPGRLFDGLGYRGFVVFGTEGVLPGCDEIRVQGGQVVAHCGGGDRWYRDPDRALERWLAASAEGRTEAGFVRMLRESTGG
jgi:hypothetical protein